MAEQLETKRFLSILRKEFLISLPDIRQIINAFHREMELGLAGKESSLKMLPAFVGRPTGKEEGSFLAVDIGGTNIRVLHVELDGKGNARISAIERFVVPPAFMRGEGIALFDFIADCIKTGIGKHKISAAGLHGLAFTFSFPVEQLSLAAGKLINWTKGFTATGVEGRDVAALLAEALGRKGLGAIRVTALTNDTVGTLAAGSYADPTCDMGVILGTGTNACYPEEISHIGRLPKSGYSEMIVNMEWGNFDKLGVNRYDQALDDDSGNRGKQRLEKMVSGMYMGELARLVIAEMTERGLLFGGAFPAAFTTKYSFTAKQMAMTSRTDDSHGISDTDGQCTGEISRIVSGRAARLAAAAITAVITWMDGGLDTFHTVAIDGSLFRKYPGFRVAMTATLGELLGDRTSRIRFAPVRDGSGIGAAIIAAAASSGREEKAG
jgi:hexokinase